MERDVASLTAWIERHVTSMNDKPPGDRFSGFIGVARHGRWVFEQGYAGAGEDEAADADTRFRIGSISKHFSAAVIVLLAEQGKLRLDAPIGKFVPGLGEDVAAVSLHDLLRHSSGIVDFTSDQALMDTWMKPHPLSDLLASFAHAPLRFAPGERFEYCNSNYLLLALAAERVTGSFEAYAQAHVFAPAGMWRTSSIDAPDAPNTASGHTADETGKRVATPVSDMILAFPGMLRSTGRDLLAWDRALAKGAVLSRASQTKLLTPHPALVSAEMRARAPTFVGYGYGINIVCDHGREVQGHNGAVAGFSAFFARIPAEGWAVVVLADTDRFEAREMGKPILQMLLTGRPSVPGVSTERPCSTIPSRAP